MRLPYGRGSDWRYPGFMQLTRRKLAAAVLAPAAAAALPQQPRPAAPSDPLAAARANLKRNAARLAAVEVPMFAEPAFQFRP